MSEHIQIVTDDAFEKTVLKATKPVLVDFWAEWCGPCRVLAPVLEEVAGNYVDKVIFGKLNVDESPQAASRYGVMSIPTLILFKNGDVLAMKMGLLSKSQLIAFIDGNI